MGTSAFIGCERSDGKVVASYCHYDGYLSGVGHTLLENWNNEDYAMIAASRGYYSGMLEKPSDIGTEKDNQANRSEKIRFDSVHEFAKEARRNGCEFAYIFSNGKWSYYSFDFCETYEVGNKFMGEVTWAALIPKFRHTLNYIKSAMEEMKEGTSHYNEYVELKEVYVGLIEKAKSFS